MLKHGEINPLNVFGLREVEHCPPHFFQVPLNGTQDVKKIKDWIYENLEGRFWIGPYADPANTTGPREKLCVGFELHGEASYFALSIDQIMAMSLTALLQ